MTLEKLQAKQAALESELKHAREQFNAWQINICRAEGALAAINQLFEEESQPDAAEEGSSA